MTPRERAEAAAMRIVGRGAQATLISRVADKIEPEIIAAVAEAIEPMKVALTVLCMARDAGFPYARAAFKDFDIAIEGLRSLLNEAGQ